MNTRRLAPVALAAAVLLGATGCSIISPQATTIQYSAADGVNIPDSGPVKVRNALLVTNDEGTAANFIAALINDTDEPQRIVVGLDGATATLRVPARTSLSLGFDGAEPLLLTDFDGQAGDDVEMSFQSGDGEGVVHSVPVLDGTLSYLTDFVPAD